MKIKRYIIKITSAILTLSFLCMDIMTYAGEEISIRSGSSNLAPRLGVTDPVFQNRYRLGELLLADGAAKSYILKQINRERHVFGKDWQERRTELVDPYAPEYQGNITARVRGLDSVMLIRVAGFVNSTGQFARVELSSKYYSDGPTFFIDSMHCNTPDFCVQKHELDEIKQ